MMDVIYTEKLDPIRVADLSAEQRAEIEETVPVVLGKMNKFIEDEVDALVGIPSNVPMCHQLRLWDAYSSCEGVVGLKCSCVGCGISLGPLCRSKAHLHQLLGARLRLAWFVHECFVA